MLRWIKVHGISLPRYGGGRGCGLTVLWEGLEAENEGVHIYSNTRWLCGKEDSRDREPMKEITASSVMFAVVGGPGATGARFCKAVLRPRPPLRG